MQSIFSASITPLASLLRPEKIDDLVGQIIHGEETFIQTFYQFQ